MGHEEIRHLLERNLAPEQQSLSTAEGLAVARAAARAAQAQGIRCALAGGLAMHLYGFTRATQDVDMLADQPLDWPVKDQLSFGGETYTAIAGTREIALDWIRRNDFFQDFYDAALRDAVEIEEGLFILSPAWLVVLKYIAGRGKDQIDLLWLLQQANLVNRDEVRSHIINVLGERAAVFPLRELAQKFQQADLGES